MPDNVLSLLATIVDQDAPESLTLEAIRAMQSDLPDASSLKQESPKKLLHTIKQPWDTRWYLNKYGHHVELLVKRPPEAINDVWG